MSLSFPFQIVHDSCAISRLFSFSPPQITSSQPSDYEHNLLLTSLSKRSGMVQKALEKLPKWYPHFDPGFQKNHIQIFVIGWKQAAMLNFLINCIISLILHSKKWTLKTYSSVSMISEGRKEFK